MQPQKSIRHSVITILSECKEKEDKGDYQGAMLRAYQALAEIQNAGAADLEALVFARLAVLLARTGRYDQARPYADQVLARESDTPAAADALLSLGICAAETDDISRGQDLLYACADLCRKIDYPAGQAWAIHSLADSVYLPRGKFTLALEMMKQGQRIRDRIDGAHWGLPFLKAYIYQTIGRRKQAREALDEMLPAVMPGTHSAGRYFYLWALLAMDEGELNKAREYLDITLRIANDSGTPILSVRARLGYSRYHRLQDSPGTALSWAVDGLDYARRIGNIALSGEASIEAAQAAWECGDATGAEDYLRCARETLAAHQADYHLAQIALLRAAWLHHQGCEDATVAWLEATRVIQAGEYAFLLERERNLAFPLIATYLRSKNQEVRAATDRLMRGLEKVSPAPLKVIGLGDFNVWMAGRLLPAQDWQRRRAGELFRFLLLQPGYQASREVILEALWPEQPPDQSVDLLHQATSTLRHILEPDLPDKFPSRYLRVEGERITLKLPEGSVIDFEEFDRRVLTHMSQRRMEALQYTLAMYRNDLYPQDRYADWSAERRTSLAERYLTTLLALGQLYLERQDFQDALICARQAIKRDAWSEDAVLLAMQASIGHNNAPQAVATYLELKERLKNDLEMEPRSDLVRLVDELRNSLQS